MDIYLAKVTSEYEVEHRLYRNLDSAHEWGEQKVRELLASEYNLSDTEIDEMIEYGYETTEYRVILEVVPMKFYD